MLRIIFSDPFAQPSPSGERVSKKKSIRITPAIKFVIGLLSLSNQELGELVKRELERNPLIEEERDEDFSQLEFNFGAKVNLHYDALITKTGYVRVNNNGIPRIKIALFVNCKDREITYSKRLNSARWLICGIKKREKILKDVLKIVGKKQRSFLYKGMEYIRPLTIKEVARELGLNSSTVCRVVKSKYIKTPWAIINLRALFIKKGECIKREIRDLMKDCILKDEEIKEILRERGISVSRRAVSNYRAMLGIPSYRERVSTRRRSL